MHFINCEKSCRHVSILNTVMINMFSIILSVLYSVTMIQSGKSHLYKSYTNTTNVFLSVSTITIKRLGLSCVNSHKGKPVPQFTQPGFHECTGPKRSHMDFKQSFLYTDETYLRALEMSSIFSHQCTVLLQNQLLIKSTFAS